jgi:hypothetical protein
VLIEQGKPAPGSMGLPADIRVVGADQWRDEMFRRGVLDKGSTNHRQDFKRLRDQLMARSIIAVRDGVVWKAFA